MIESLKDKMYISQIGEKLQFWIQKLSFQKFIPGSMSEIPTRIRTQDLRFTSPILKSLRYDDMQPNRLIQTMQFNKTFKSLSCNSLSLGAVRFLNCLFSATSQNRRLLYKQVNNFGSLLFNIFMFNRAFIISMKI